jgi:Cysteine-rich CWC
MTQLPSSRRLVCARCGAEFECGNNSECWCAAEPYRLPMTKAWIEDCLCPACLRKSATALAESRRAAEDGR